MRHSPPRDPCLSLVERGAPRGGRNGSPLFSASHRLAATWDPALEWKIATPFPPRPGKEQRGDSKGGDHQNLSGTDDLVSEYQYFPRSPLGAGTGDLRGGPVSTPDASGRGVCTRVAGRRSALSKDGCTVKHYAVHSGPEELRHKFDAVVSASDFTRPISQRSKPVSVRAARCHS